MKAAVLSIAVATVLGVLPLDNAFSAPKRIESVSNSQSSVGRIYLNTGMVTVVEFPREVTEVRIGNPSEFKIQISNVNPREITISRAGATQRPSNLIVRAGRELWVFDLVPSRTSHQDFVRVRSGVGPGEGKVLERLKLGGK